MWEVIKEPHEQILADGHISKYEVPGIKRKEDGLTVVWESGTHEGIDVFLCRGSFGEFRFQAWRWDDRKNEPLDKYLIFPGEFLSTLWNRNIDEKKNRELCLSHAKDIESALLNFPLFPIYKNIPVKEVLFNISPPGIAYRYVHAEEI